MSKETILKIFERYVSGHDAGRKIYETRFDEIADEILREQAKNLHKPACWEQLKLNKMDVIITGFSKPTSEGVVLHLNKPARLKTGTGHFKEIWVSWDKIGAALFDGYTEKMEVDERNELRGKV